MFQAHKSIYKQYIKKSLQKIAIDLRLLRQRNYHTIESLLGCDLIIDIGANFGQYANDRFLDGYEGEIISIEPLSYPHSKLLTASLQRPNWKVAPRYAISDQDTTIEINVSENYASSTIEQFTEFHKKIPGVNPNSIESVKCVTLTHFYHEFSISQSKKVYVKIDTNGHEAKVLSGISPECLSNIEAFQIEVPIAQMYENQTGFDYYNDIMRDWGFNFYDAHDGVRSNNGANQVMDIVFIKSDSILFN